MTDQTPRRKPSFGELLIYAALVLFVVVLWRSAKDSGGAASVGKPLPELRVAGWVGDTPVSRDELAGKVVVLDFWATWCPPCVASMPKLAKVHDEYAPKGVVLIGITAEGESDRKKIEDFVAARDGMTWPVAYGGTLVFDDLGVYAMPTIVVFDRDGRAVWGGHSVSQLRKVLDEQLEM